MSYKTLVDIKEGWVNYVKSKRPRKNVSESIESMALSRAEICKKCEYLVPRPFVRKLGYRCSKCGCSFPANVYAPKKKCPIGKW